MSSFSLNHLIVKRETDFNSVNIHFRNKLRSSNYLVESLEVSKTLKGHRGCVNSVLFSQDGYWAFTGSDDTYVNIYNVDSSELKLRLPTKHTGNIFYVKDLAGTGGNTIVTCAADGHVMLTDIENNASVSLFKHKKRAHRISMIPDSPCQFYSCGEDGKVNFFDIRTVSIPAKNLFTTSEVEPLAQTLFQSKASQPCPIYCIHVNPMKPYEIAVCGATTYVSIYDARKFTKPISYLFPNHLLDSHEHITGIKYDYSGNIIVASYNDENVYTMDTSLHAKSDLAVSTTTESKNNNNNNKVTGNEVSNDNDNNGYENKFIGHRNNDTVKQVGFFGSRSEWIVSGSDCGNVFIWETSSSKLINIMKGDNTGAINCLDNHPYIPMLATSGLSNKAKLWEPTGLHQPLYPVTSKNALYSRNVMKRNDMNRRRNINNFISPLQGISSNELMSILFNYMTSSSNPNSEETNPLPPEQQVFQHFMDMFHQHQHHNDENDEEEEENENNWEDMDENEEHESENEVSEESEIEENEESESRDEISMPSLTADSSDDELPELCDESSSSDENTNTEEIKNESDNDNDNDSQPPPLACDSSDDDQPSLPRNNNNRDRSTENHPTINSTNSMNFVPQLSSSITNASNSDVLNNSNNEMSILQEDSEDEMPTLIDESGNTYTAHPFSNNSENVNISRNRSMSTDEYEVVD